MRAPPSGGGAGRRAQESSGTPEPTRSAPAHQALTCAACGAAGTPPTIKTTQNAGVRLTLGVLLGQFRLLCDDCKTTLALERAARRGRVRP